MKINQALLSSLSREELIRHFPDWLLDEEGYYLLAHLFTVLHQQGTHAALQELTKFRPLEHWEQQYPL